MKNTALTEIHSALGAKIVPFAGYNMPVQYEGVNIEHETVRNGVGVFDVSHMGEFFISGPKALDLMKLLSAFFYMHVRGRLGVPRARRHSAICSALVGSGARCFFGGALRTISAQTSSAVRVSSMNTTGPA